MNRAASGFAVVFVAASFAGCGNPPPLFGDKPVTPSGMNNQGPPPDLWMKPQYPGGPYGHAVGDTVEDFDAPGFRLNQDHNDSSLLEWVKDIKISDYFATNCKCLLMSWGASWCGACQSEQPALIADIEADGEFCVLGILQEGPVNGSNKVTKEDVEAWTQKFMHNFPVVQGDANTKSFWNEHANNGSIGLPFNLVIRTSDMTVATESIQGFDPKIHDRAMEACAQ